MSDMATLRAEVVDAFKRMRKSDFSYAFLRYLKDAGIRLAGKKYWYKSDLDECLDGLTPLEVVEVYFNSPNFNSFSNFFRIGNNGDLISFSSFTLEMPMVAERFDDMVDFVIEEHDVLDSTELRRVFRSEHYKEKRKR